MRTGRGERSTRRKPVPVALCPPEIPHELTWGSAPGRRSEKSVTNRLNYLESFSFQHTRLGTWIAATQNPIQTYIIYV
jgi:hypothetical protein